MFLGFTKDELEDAVTEVDNTYQQQITRFLNLFEMPDCGASTLPILHKVVQKAGISQPSRRKKPPPTLGIAILHCF